MYHAKVVEQTIRQVEPSLLLKNQQPAAFLPWGVKRLLFSRSQLSPSRTKQRVSARHSANAGR